MALNSCIHTLSTDILNDCNVQYGKGAEKRAFIFSRSVIDWDASVVDFNTGIISKLVLLPNTRGYRMTMPSSTPYTGLTNEDQNVAIGMSFNKTVPVILLPNSPTSSQTVRALKSDDYVIVWEARVKGSKGEQAFPVVGWETGCKGADATFEAYNDDTQGGWSINMREEGATTPQIFLAYADGYKATLTALESMTVPIENGVSL